MRVARPGSGAYVTQCAAAASMRGLTIQVIPGISGVRASRNVQARTGRRRTSVPKNGMRPIHPGEFLREDFLIPLKMSAIELARALKVPPNRITLLLQEKRGLTADTALRLARYFGTTAEYWMRMQAAYDLRTAESDNARTIRAEVTPRQEGSADARIARSLPAAQ